MTPARRRRRRPAQRRQVDAGQPHRRPARGDRGGAARRHARPQGGRGRVERPRRSCWSTPAAGCPAATTLDDKVSRQAERAMPTPTSCCSSSTPPSASPRRTTAVAALLRAADTPVLARRQQGRRRPTASSTIWEFARARPRRPVPGAARSTAGGTGDLLDARRRRARPRPSRRPTPTRRREPTTRPTAVRGRDRRPAQRRQVAPCSTGSSATTAPSCTTCPAPPATPSTPSSRPTTGPIRFVDTAGMRRKSRDRRAHRVLLARARAAGRSTAPTSRCS